MPRHGRASFSPSASSSSVLVSSAPPLLHPHSNTPYGLLEPSHLNVAPGSYSPTKQPPHLYGEPLSKRNSPPSISARRHHRKSSSLASVGLPTVTVPAWSEVEAGIGGLRDRSIEFGAGIGELGGQICGRVPAVRGGVAFLSTLRSNLQLSTSLAPPSPYLHPISPLPPKIQPSAYPTSIIMPSTPVKSSPKSSPTPASQTSPSPAVDDPLSSIPPLTYNPATSEDDRFDALKLIADGVAQKRQTTASDMIRSPACLELFVAIFGVAYQFLLKERSDWPILLTTFAGLVMSVLTGIRFLVGGYLNLAEKINWSWLDGDDLVMAKFDEEIIGSAAVRVQNIDIGVGANGGRKRGKNEKIAVIRAWTIRKRERSRGVGRGLLEAIVEKYMKGKGCVDVRFAEEGENIAGEGRVLPVGLEVATGVADKQKRRESRAAEMLKEVVAEGKKSR